MTDPMKVYDQIKAIGPEAKSEADAFMQELTHKYTQDHPAPPELLQQGLNSILSKYSKHDQSGNSNRGTYLTGLLGTLGAAAGFAAGAPAIGLVGILVAGTALLSKYQTKQQESAH